MGLGHLYRCLALAEMLPAYFQCTLVTRDLPEALRAEFLSVFGQIEEFGRAARLDPAAEVLSLAERLSQALPAPIIVLDGYHFDTAYQRSIKQAGYKLVCIDDIHAVHYLADVVINHAGGIPDDAYSVEPYTQLLTGPKYALIRQGFLTKHKREETPLHGFICLGGADPPNATLKVLRRCREVYPAIPYSVVIGGAYLHRAALEQYIGEQAGDIDLLSNLSASDMAAKMSASTFGVTSPSTVSFEYLNCGGLLYLEMIADNQKRINDFYLEAGVALSFSNDFPVRDEARRREVLANKARLFDGRSPVRCAELFNKLARGEDYITD